MLTSWRHVLRGPVADVALSAALLAAGQAEAWGRFRLGGDGPIPHGAPALTALMAGLATLPLVWRRRRPLAAAAAVAAALTAQVLVVEPGVSFLAGLLPLMICLYSVAAWAPERRRLLGLTFVVVAQGVMALRVTEMGSTPELIFGTFVITGTWFAGDLARRQRGQAHHAVAHVQQLEREREKQRRVAVADERDRISRELHDVVAHSVSLMGVQAGAARTQLDVDPECARSALLAIEATARDAVVELRRLLLVLRDGECAPGFEPQPGLGAIEPLVTQMRSAGLPVALVIEGDAAALSPGVALSAYRIVQEALTNALKHAGGAASAVHIRYADDAVELEIADAGAGLPRAAVAVGHGLVGMRERAALYGGSLEAGPRADGGFTVRATLPRNT